MCITEPSDRDIAYQYMLKNPKPNLRQYALEPREAINTYNTGGFVFPDQGSLVLETYKDGVWRRKHSMIVAAFLLGLPFPKPIVAENLGKGRLTIVSGERTHTSARHAKIET